MNQPALDLRTIRAVILDMDGVIWLDADILPGVPDFFVWLCERGIPYAMATNNSSKAVAEYRTRLNNLGIPIGDEHILTSGVVTADELARTYPPDTPIYVIGSDSLVRLLAERGYPVDPDQAQVVVVGLDVTLTYEKLLIAGQRILGGAEFIGTNGDLTLPVPSGLAPGNGSIIAALQAMTGRTARLMGKPEPAMFRAAINRLGVTPLQTLMIGDRLDTDILGAQQAGLRTALVLTGVSRAEEIGPITPDGVYSDLAVLHAAWRQ